MKAPQFTIAAILILTAIVAAFFAGRQSTLRERTQLTLQAEAERAQAMRFQERLRLVEELSAKQSATLDQTIAHLSKVRKPLRLLAWNVESGGNDPAIIAQQLTELGGYDIYGLTEVGPSSAPLYREALGDSFKSIVTSTGGGDRMMLLYSSRLQAIEHAELEAHDGVRMNDVNFRHRSPLMARFKHTSSDIKFIVVLNHLARGNAELRKEQAKGLRLWAAAQDVPVLGIGDYNFDFDFPTRKGNKAFDEFLVGDTWTWIEPKKLVDTNWADRDEDGKDDYPDSCLDFMFMANAGEWKAESRVIVRDGDFPDDETTSDHRPVELVVRPSE